eukprot:719478-Rhodomonas_salina.2
MEAAKVFVQIVQGIKYLHSIGIVHRDLKPDNIMFADKEGEAIKICDYGSHPPAPPTPSSKPTSKTCTRAENPPNHYDSCAKN